MLSCGVLLQFFGIRVEDHAPWIGLAFMALLVVGCALLTEVFEKPARRALSRLLIRHQHRRRTPDDLVHDQR
jgi:peptidoglycan/LPS O-acetylase OafA/YrhL